MRKTRKSATTAVLTAFVLLGSGAAMTPASAGLGSPAQGTTGSPADAAPPASDVIEESDRLRDELGFPPITESRSAALAASASPASTYADPGGEAQASRRVDLSKNLLVAATAEAEDATNDWGFIGTEAEAQEMRRRESLDAAVSQQFPTPSVLQNYAGDYFDPSQGGRLVFQFDGPPPTNFQSELTNTAVAAGSDQSDVQIKSVAFSSVELVAGIDEFLAWAEGNGLKDEIASIYEDVNNNRIVVGTPGNRLADLRARGRQMAVPIVFRVERAEDSACSSRNVCDVYQRGGVGISGPNGGLCTSGFALRRRSVNGIITAGHCWHAYTSGTVRSGSGTFGTLNTVQALGGDGTATNADMRWIAATAVRAWVYVSSSAPSAPVEEYTYPRVGGTTCLFGRNDPVGRCGTITGLNATHFSSTTGARVAQQVRYTVRNKGGDSGGAVTVNKSTSRVQARGIQIAGIGEKDSNGYYPRGNYTQLRFSDDYDMGLLIFNP